MATVRVYVNAPIQQHQAPRRARPFEVMNRLLQAYGWYGAEGGSVPLQGSESTGRVATEAELKFLWQNRRLLVDPKSGVQCNFHLALEGLVGVIKRGKAYITRLREEENQTLFTLVDSGHVSAKILTGKFTELFYASQVMEELLLNDRVTASTAFAINEEHAALIMDLSSLLVRFLKDDFETMASKGSQEDSPLVRFQREDKKKLALLRQMMQVIKMLIGVEWYLLRAFIPVACLDILRHLKSVGVKAAATCTDLFRWFNVVSSSALQYLCSSAGKEFDNVEAITAEFIVDVMCKVQFEDTQFQLLAQRHPQLHVHLAHLMNESLFLICRSTFLIVRQLGGHPHIAFSKPAFAAKMNLPFTAASQRSVREHALGHLRTKLSDAAQKGPDAGFTLLHLFAAAALGATDVIEPFFVSFSGQDIVVREEAPSGDTPKPLVPERVLVSMMKASPMPPSFLPRATLLAFGMSAPDAYFDTLCAEKKNAVLAGVLRGFVEHVVQESAFASKDAGNVETLHPMLFSHIVPLLTRHVGAADAAGSHLAHHVLLALDKISDHIASIMLEFGAVAPPARFQQHSLSIWEVAFTLASNIVRNPSLGSDDAALIIRLLSKLYPVYHMDTVLSSQPSGSGNKQQQNKKAQEYSRIKALLRDAMNHCVGSDAAVEKVTASAFDLVSSAEFGKVFSITQQAHVYALALGSIEASKSLSVKAIVKHTIPVALACLKCVSSPSIRLCGHDALVAPILAKHRASVMIIPSYVNTFAPAASSKGPPISLLNTFSRFVRGVCQSVEQCEALDTVLSAEDKKELEPELTDSSLSSIKGLGAALHVVQAVYDNACRFCDVQVQTQDSTTRKKYYIASLINTTQCSDPHVLSRSCASIEDLIISKLRNPAEQDFWVGYAQKVVQQSVNYSTKKDLTEWVVTLEETLKNHRASLGGPAMMSKL